MKNTEKQSLAAKQFAQFWAGKGYEKGESQTFWLTLLEQVLGVSNPEKYITFEHKVKLDHTAFIDAFIPSTHVMIEQKSLDKDLGAPIRQGDGVSLTPFQQAKRYAAELPYSQRPRWIVTCNFAEFWVYDMEQPNGEPQKILLKDLEKEYYRLQFLVDEQNDHLKREMEVSVKAGDLVGKIYDKLLCQYHDPSSAETLRSLNVLCVRLVFCLYAEDALIFGKKTAFHDYLAQYPARDMRRALIDLFVVLDTPCDKRDPYLDPTLNAFPYVNGGLFSESDSLLIPQFTDELRQMILSNASDDFDWSEISPTIFGAVFESTLNPETRRSGGMHYTSIENIHKVIDPLFLDDLRKELDTILEEKQERQRARKLDEYQNKLASLTFLDPACGSGNFLTETYLSLRRLENEAISARHHGQAFLGIEEANPIKVSIHQFYGIEINDFAVTVATTALWISEAQMLAETEKIIRHDIDFLPLKSYTNIKEGNALRLPWDEWEVKDETISVYAERAYVFPRQETVAKVSEPETIYEKIDIYADETITHTKPKEKQFRHVDFDYIMGNPPFVGARWMSKEQKQDVIDIFGAKWQGVGDLDYVCCWYKKTIGIMAYNTKTRAALVSTNSICQGGSVTNLWKPLFIQHNVHIDFAYRTFRWDSEADIKAHVHCVIIGFSKAPNEKPKTIYLSDNHALQAANINGYLLDAPNVFIEKRLRPICDVPLICLGGQPIDDGNLVLTNEEKEELLAKEPQAVPLLRPFMMGKDFIERKPRYCLWLKDANPTLLRQCCQVMERVQKVREFRLGSNRESTLKAADTPTLFGAPFECSDNYIALPKVSSENRRYIPMDYLSPDIIPGDKLFCMQNASLYHFGVLMSNVHMAWTRVTCGRLKSDYSYSNTIVYNNFPWPNPTDAQRTRIEQTAQAILDIRVKYPDSSLADLYDEAAMPPDLRKAHQDNDRAVMQAYGFSTKMSESECVAALFKLYEDLT
jgi:type I restriction-modification system DNA methylase subunit